MSLLVYNKEKYENKNEKERRKKDRKQENSVSR